MKKRTLFTLTMALAVLGSFVSALKADAQERKPNIVFILADDLGYGDLGCYGQKIIKTPVLDRLASEGMRFTQHYAGSPVCGPSRCVLMTGKHPGRAFIRDNSEVGSWYSFEGQMPLPASEPSLALALKSAGYITAAIGKWGLGNTGNAGDPLKHGFDHFFGYTCQRHAHNFYPHYLVDDGKKIELAENKHVSPQMGLSIAPGADPNDAASYVQFKGGQYAPDLCAERALKFIRENKDRPFYLYYPTTVPHLALQVPDDSLAEYIGKLDNKPYTGGDGYLPHQHPRAAYAAMITRMDRDIGKMVQLVADLGLEQDTIFIFTSDNGAVYPLSGVDPVYFKSNGDLRGYKGAFYEGGIRVPLIVRWKGRVPDGKTSDIISGFEDWFPTLLELANASDKSPKGLDGMSIAPTLLGKNQTPRPFLYREFYGYGGQQFVREGDWKLLRLNLVASKRGPAAPVTELYNLASDPAEKRNVAAQHPDIVARLQAIMDKQHTLSKQFPFKDTLDKPAS